MTNTTAYGSQAGRPATAALVLAIIAVASVAVVFVVAGSRTASATTVTVNVTIPAMLETTFTDTGVSVRANAPWQLTAQAPSGELISIDGVSTRGQIVELPEGATAVAVCLR